MKEYDESAAIDLILSRLAENGITDMDENIVVEALDSIWDAYDELHLDEVEFNDSISDEELLALEEKERQAVIDFVVRQMKGNAPERDIVAIIYDAELEYEESLI